MQQSPTPKPKEENQEPQQQQNSNPHPPPERVQYYPIFYIQPNFPLPADLPVQPPTISRPWFVCHPVSSNDPFFPYISQISQPFNIKTNNNAQEIKIEDNDESQHEQSLNQRQKNSLKNKNKETIKQQKAQPKTKKLISNPEIHNHQPCNCSQSNCLKRYCACFHSGRMCLEDCKCTACKNCSEFTEERDQAINHVYKKCHRDKNVPIQELLQISVSYGCRCKSTGCKKKYCECYKRNQMCGKLCLCEDCTNVALNKNIQDGRRKKISILK